MGSIDCINVIYGNSDATVLVELNFMSHRLPAIGSRCLKVLGVWKCQIIQLICVVPPFYWQY
jgi:hypothetical protein